MKILHADEHTLFRDGLRHILTTLDDDLEFLEADTLASARNSLTFHDDIDLVLLDIQLSDLSGCAGLRLLWETNPTIPLVVLTACEDRSLAKQAIESGAAGYVPKSVTSQTLLNALRIVLNGGIYAPRSLSHAPAQNGFTAPRHSILTRRQLEVLALMSEGLPNKLIARQLFVSEATVKGHVTAILDILGVKNRMQAVNKVRSNGHQFVGSVMRKGNYQIGIQENSHVKPIRTHAVGRNKSRVA